MPTIKEREKREENTKMTENNQQVWEQNQIIHGWENATSVAEEMWRLGNLKMLDGNLVFAYKDTTAGNKFYQIVISQNLTVIADRYVPTGGYSVSIVTQGYSAALPNVPLEYLEIDVLDDLENYKVDKRIIGTYKLILENLRKNQN